jgi:SAM-dependent methyltransferase
MSYTALAERLPAPLRRHILHFESAIADAVDRFALDVPRDAWVLDAGAGEGRYAKYFRHARYCGIDLAIGDPKWNYKALDAVADLSCLPLRPRSVAACLNIVTLEHVKDPKQVVGELFRVLQPGGRLLLVVPHEWEVHQAPHDYFRYTRHGVALLLEQAGFRDYTITPAGGYFRLLSRRLMNGLQFFAGGARWLLFLPALILIAPAALLLPILDPLDSERNFTLGYICVATRPEA